MPTVVTDKIKHAIHHQEPEAKIILYGSRAGSSFSKESDWDILVLLNKPNVSFEDEQAIRHLLFDIELETGEPISTFVYSLDDWNTRLSATPLYQSIKREGIYL